MQLILGGRMQGKLAFALRLSGHSPEDVSENWLSGEGAEKPIWNRLHLGIRQLVERGIDPQPRLLALVEQHPAVLILCDEVGSGIVPMQPLERAYRDAVGRICCLLAERAERVIRVQCGIPMVLKGASL